MKAFCLCLLLLSTGYSLIGQQKPLDHEAYDRWRTIEKPALSNDGKWLTYVLKPDRGDPTLVIRDLNKKQDYHFERGSNAQISFDNEHIVFKISPPLDTLWARERNKVKKKEWPKDSMGIFTTQDQNLEKFARVKDFSLPKKGSGWLAFRTFPENENDEKALSLNIRSLTDKAANVYPKVSDYVVAEDGHTIGFITDGDSLTDEGVYLFKTNDASVVSILKGKGNYKNIGLSYTSKHLVFLADLDTLEKRIPNFDLQHYDIAANQLTEVIRIGEIQSGGDWLLSEHQRVSFSRDEQKVFIGVAPPPLLEDTALVADEIVEVDIWHYQDGLLQTQQKVNAEQERKRAYTGVYHLESHRFVQLGSLEVPEVKLSDEGNSGIQMGLSELPYQQEKTWVSPTTAKDIYSINDRDGTSTLLAKGVRGRMGVSPKGKFFYWYNLTDSAWFAHDLSASETRQLTAKAQIPYRETWDYPDYPQPYGMAGWLENDEKMLVYDRFDIWALDPTGTAAPANLTNGRASNTRYRYVKLDPEERFISKSTPMLLHAYNELDKRQGYFEYQPNGNKAPRQLVFDDYRYGRVVKAREANRLIYTKEDFQTFPDLQLSNLSFKKSEQVSNANPQQSEYLWGSEEMYYWHSADGIPLEGILYKPANFDSAKQYPMIVYFYRRYSDRFHQHFRPYPGRSIINFSFYTSRGYVVFVPDVVYKIGYPGESAFNSIMPGVTQLIKDGFINPERIGVQGHSWGGYQISYLITRTNLFRAAEAGAPVSNMVSAYGGIRWETGLSRMFQYERTQSRIGGTLWETPLRYLENSPIFWLDKVETPLLIMHNDKDGHVPWYQGIELFVGLRRLGKPSWMLTYNDQPHWPLKYQNRLDFQIRMAQYFDHYLKDEPAPEWLKKGVPAIEKKVNKGYELMDGDEY